MASVRAEGVEPYPATWLRGQNCLYLRRGKRADAQYLVDIPFDELDSDTVAGQWVGGGEQVLAHLVHYLPRK